VHWRAFSHPRATGRPFLLSAGPGTFWSLLFALRKQCQQHIWRTAAGTAAAGVLGKAVRLGVISSDSRFCVLEEQCPADSGNLKVKNSLPGGLRQEPDVAVCARWVRRSELLPKASWIRLFGIPLDGTIKCQAKEGVMRIRT